jgi:hypothetical protein
MKRRRGRTAPRRRQIDSVIEVAAVSGTLPIADARQRSIETVAERIRYERQRNVVRRSPWHCGKRRSGGQRRDEAIAVKAV